MIRTLRAVLIMEAWLVKFLREAKTLPELLCEDFVVSGELGLSKQLRSRRGQNHWRKIFVSLG